MFWNYILENRTFTLWNWIKDNDQDKLFYQKLGIYHPRLDDIDDSYIMNMDEDKDAIKSSSDSDN